jgi:bla regulator protein blaR1
MMLALSILLKATATTAAALTAARLARRTRAAVRHLLLAAAFAILLGLPIASGFAPPMRILLPIAPPTATASSAGPVAMLLTVEPPPRAPDEAVSAPPWRVVATPSASIVLFVLWIAGALLFLVRVAVGLWQTRGIRRTALPWRHATLTASHRGNVDLLLHDAVPGPMTCGTLHPAIVLPADARWWTDEDLHRAIVHELAHVRRGDWLTQSIASAVAAIYWFHPLVWIALRQFALEAEHACDDAVLLRRAEATEYANQLVTLAQRMLHHRNASLVAMAGRGHLPSRVRALLDADRRRGPAGAGWIAVAAVASVLAVASMSAVQIVATQRTDESAQRFEVASIKPCRNDPGVEGMRRPEFRIPSPDRIVLECVTLERLMHVAYAGLGSGRSSLLNTHPLSENIVRGGPPWVRSERFNVEAKAARAVDRGTLVGPMLRALLEERFHVKTHRATEEAPLYALTVAKSGFKLKPIADDDCTPEEAVTDVPPGERFRIQTGPKPVCGSWSTRGDTVNRTHFIGGMTLEEFAHQLLSSAVDRFVIDSTGVGGRFNFHFTYGMDRGAAAGTAAGSDAERGPSIFTALEEQLGLKLERTKGPRQFLIVDSVQRPDPN